MGNLLTYSTETDLGKVETRTTHSKIKISLFQKCGNNKKGVTNMKETMILNQHLFHLSKERFHYSFGDKLNLC